MKLFNIARMLTLMSMAILSIQSFAEAVTVTACSTYNSADGQWADCKGPFDVKDLADLRAQVAKTLGSSVNPREIGVRTVGADGKFKSIHTGDSLAPVNHGRVQYAVLSSSRDAGTGGTSTPMPTTPMRKAPPVPGAAVASGKPFEVTSPTYGNYTFKASSLSELKAQIAAKVGATADAIIVKDPSLDMDVDDSHFKMFASTGSLYPFSFEVKSSAAPARSIPPIMASADAGTGGTGSAPVVKAPARRMPSASDVGASTSSTNRFITWKTLNIAPESASLLKPGYSTAFKDVNNLADLKARLVDAIPALQQTDFSAGAPKAIDKLVILCNGQTINTEAAFTALRDGDQITLRMFGSASHASLTLATEKIQADREASASAAAAEYAARPKLAKSLTVSCSGVGSYTFRVDSIGALKAEIERRVNADHGLGTSIDTIKIYNASGRQVTDGDFDYLDSASMLTFTMPMETGKAQEKKTINLAQNSMQFRQGGGPYTFAGVTGFADLKQKLLAVARAGGATDVEDLQVFFNGQDVTSAALFDQIPDNNKIALKWAYVRKDPYASQRAAMGFSR